MIVMAVPDKNQHTRTPSGENPLSCRTIAVTRAREQAGNFVQLLEDNGARVIICPTIQIIDPESYDAADRAIEHLYGYDWLIFTSVNGVDYFMRRLRRLGRDAPDLDHLRVCAIGSPTAERLIDERVHVDVIPQQFKAEGILQALELFLGTPLRIAGLNFLIPRAAVARDYLPKALEKAGARADIATVYRTIPASSSERGRIKAMIEGGAVDCVTFLSSSAVVNFAQMFETDNLGTFLDGVVIASIGDITASAVTSYGLRTSIQPSESTVPSLVRAIVDYFSGDGKTVTY